MFANNRKYFSRKFYGHRRYLGISALLIPKYFPNLLWENCYGVDGTRNSIGKMFLLKRKMRTPT